MPAINFRLLLVTDRHQTNGRSLPTVLTEAIQAGVPAIQLRERDLPTAELLPLAQAIWEMTEPQGIPLLINDRADLAMALKMEGVHLRANSLPLSTVRRIVGPHRLIGISTHSIDEARQAHHDGADYIVFGPIFETPSKRPFGPPLGLHALAAVCRKSTVPIIAIGGITLDRVRDIRRAGAYGVAVIGALLMQDDVGAAVREFTSALEKA